MDIVPLYCLQFKLDSMYNFLGYRYNSLYNTYKGGYFLTNQLHASMKTEPEVLELELKEFLDQDDCPITKDTEYRIVEFLPNTYKDYDQR